MKTIIKDLVEAYTEIMNSFGNTVKHLNLSICEGEKNKNKKQIIEYISPLITDINELIDALRVICTPNPMDAVNPEYTMLTAYSISDDDFFNIHECFNSWIKTIIRKTQKNETMCKASFCGLGERVTERALKNFILNYYGNYINSDELDTLFKYEINILNLLKE